MIIVFDLDDTLYEERTYVESGFHAVAEWGVRFGWDAALSFERLMAILESEGRGRVFDRWLEEHGRRSRMLVREAVNAYRRHTPTIQLAESARRLLAKLRNARLYLVTDGHSGVQAKKVEALGLRERFERVYLTYRHGRKHSKPSTYCFELIRKREMCRWDEMVYIGDDPAKDFVNLNPLGVHTVRVLTGRHRDVVAKAGYDSAHRIDSLDELPPLLARLNQNGERSSHEQ